MNEFFALLEQAQKGNERACEQFLCENSGLIWSVVKRYSSSGADYDDLYQLGCIGFIKAVKGFNITYGTQFSTYAVPKIAGEIRRYLRDDGAVKVGRTLREKGLILWRAKKNLCEELGRDPVLSELSDYINQPPEEIASIELANIAPESLQQENDDGFSLESTLGNNGIEDMLIEKITLREAIEELQDRERSVIFLRYFKCLTQQQTARILQVSQVQVSRLERRAISRLRDRLACC